MQWMRLFIFSWKQFEDAFENAQWRKVKQMRPMWFCLFTGRPFDETFENAQWRKVKQMQPMWLCLFRPFEETCQNTQRQKDKHVQLMWLCLFSGRSSEVTFGGACWRLDHWSNDYHRHLTLNVWVNSEILVICKILRKKIRNFVKQKSEIWLKFGNLVVILKFVQNSQNFGDFLVLGLFILRFFILRSYIMSTV